MKRAFVLVAVCNLPFSAAGFGQTWGCPGGYRVHAGLNTDFPSDGVRRAFVVLPPRHADRPTPVWVPLTGSGESTDENLYAQRGGANAKLADRGTMVIGPIRQCAGQDPGMSVGACNGPGHQGWAWNPWHEGRAGGPAGEPFKNDERPDPRFLVDMVKCVGTRFPLDQRRIYVGGISSGGTMTIRALTFRSDFWAGGMPISGEWYVTRDDGSALAFDAAREAVKAAPDVIHQGRVGAYPLRTKLGPMVVIVVCGGGGGIWYSGATLCADYRPSTEAASNDCASSKNVVEISCTVQDGHMWPQIDTDGFNLWALDTLASFPKGSDPSRFRLTASPEGYSCKLGPFIDHYGPDSARSTGQAR